MESTLFAKVAMLIAGCMLVGAAGTYFGRFIRSLGALLALCVVFLVGGFVVMAAAHASPVIGIITLGGWVFISGLVMGPGVQMYAEDLGWETVTLAYAGSAGVMVACGGIGMLSRVDFSDLGPILFIGLLGLILVGVVRIFVRLGREANLIVSSFGMLIFAAYFLFDFFRITNGANTWENAIGLAMTIYLNLINFFLYLLQFLEALHKH